MIYQNPNIRMHRLTCECGCGNGLDVYIRVQDIPSSEDVAISTLCSCFMAHQDGIWETIKKRVRAAWLMLTGKEYLLHDIVVDRLMWKEMMKTMLEEMEGCPWES